MNAFLIFWLSGWTVACVGLLVAYLRGFPTQDGSTIPLWFVLVFWAVEIVMGRFFLLMLFARRTFRLDCDRLAYEMTSVLYRERELIPKESIQTLVQIKDGGEDEDSFPSWGLTLEASDGKTELLFRQAYEKSEWLGQILAQWAEVPYLPAPKE